MNHQIKMWLLVALMFAILYGIVTAVGSYMGIGSVVTYTVMAVAFVGFQYLIGPAMVQRMMRVKWVSAEEEPELHAQIDDLARQAGMPKPKVGISELQIPNAFAFGRSVRDGRVCVTQGLRRMLDENELKAVLGHEVAHIKNRDMLIMTLLSVIPLICYWLAWSLIWGGSFGRRRQSSGYAMLIGLGAMVLYFVTNLLVLAGSRIREYSADELSVRLGSRPHYLASALYKLVYGSARARESTRGKQELQQVEGIRAFFLNDVGKAAFEINDLKELDRDFSGAINQRDLEALRAKEVRLETGEKIAELFTTHPNMLKRIKHLSGLPG